MEGNEASDAFGSGEPFTVGVEEELFLVDPVSGRQTNASEAVQDRIGPVIGTVERELHACQVELITEVCDSVGEAVGMLHASELGYAGELARLPALVAKGGGAGRQRACFEIAGMDALLREASRLTACADD